MLGYVEHLTLRDLVPEEVPDSIEAASRRFEEAGWYPRSRWGKDSVRYWPENGRRFQYALDIHTPINLGIARLIKEKTGVDVDDLAVDQKGERDASNRLPSES